MLLPIASPVQTLFLSNLPDEIIEYILKFLNIYDIANKNQASKLWNQIIPPVITQKSIILDNKIYFERHQKYNLYDNIRTNCINSECPNYQSGFSVIYFPAEDGHTLPDMIPEDMLEEYYGIMDYPIYGYELPPNAPYMFDRLEICQQSPHTKENLLYCPQCIKKYEIIPKTATYGTFYSVA